MKRTYKLWAKRFLRWLFKHIHRLFNKSNHVFQSISGNRNQAIGVMRDRSVAISNVENLIQQFHLSPQEILSLQSFWENWSQETEPPLTSNLVIGGRDQACTNILSWLRGSPSLFTLQGDSPEEAIAFLGAVVQDLEDEERTKVFPVQLSPTLPRLGRALSNRLSH
jgi:hypothetical protein